jgi:iron complex outermembrane recepter protein
MSRSRKRKLARHPLLSREHNSRARSLAPAVAGAVCAALSPGWVLAQESGALEEVVVTAQKRSESLQDVPLSIQAIGSQRLEDLSVKSFDDYVRFLPSVNFQTGAPGFASVYMRGIASGENSNHSGPLPSVGIYLDEQPITTIQGALDVHIYDIARVEALAGPQGTLYGASSQAGTIRIITNKPDAEAFDAGFSVEGNMVSKGDLGYVAEGFVNLPVGERAAIRLVGFAKRDAGFIDNVPGTRTYPTSGICMSNASTTPAGCERTPVRAKDDYNDVDTYGARAALRVDLNEEWSITPSVLAQSQDANGSFGYDPAVGDLKLHTYYPTFSEDDFVQAALTVQGKIGNFDLVYAGAYLKRDVILDADYSDYAFFYDTYYTNYCTQYPADCFEWGAQFVNDNGDLINPSQFIHGTDGYTMESHELRIASPKENRFRVVAGLFYQDFEHEIFQRYQINDLATDISVPLWDDTIWLTNQLREDQSQAIFGELSFDFTDKLTGTAGIRYYEYDNSLRGFFGFNENYYSGYGTAQCFSAAQYNGSPCTNLDANVDDSGNVPKLNLTYRFSDGKLVYATYSEGFRPGGVNRNDGSPYDADYLKNYELGWKTTWANGRVRVNGALFHEEWDDIQYGYLPPGGVGLTVIRNVGAAEIDGVEFDLGWAPIDALLLSGGFTWLDAALTKDYFEDPADPPAALKGDRLPVTPELKANALGRYQFPLGTFGAYAQAAVVYTGDSYSDLTRSDRSYTGKQDSYTIVDLAFGLTWDAMSLDFFLSNALDELARTSTGVPCAYFTCGGNPYFYPNQPRTFGVRFTQGF